MNEGYISEHCTRGLLGTSGKAGHVSGILMH